MPFYVSKNKCLKRKQETDRDICLLFAIQRREGETLYLGEGLPQDIKERAIKHAACTAQRLIGICPQDAAFIKACAAGVV